MHNKADCVSFVMWNKMIRMIGFHHVEGLRWRASEVGARVGDLGRVCEEGDG